MSADEFRAVMRAAAWDLAVGTAARLTELLEVYGGEPAWWAADVKRIVQRCRAKTTDEYYWVPTDLRDGANPDGAVELFREFVARYGHLL